MKWFFAANARSVPVLENLLKVAVITSKRTSLVPYCLFDGPDCPLTDWIQKNGGTVVKTETSFKDLIRDHTSHRYMVATGALLRLDIPMLPVVGKDSFVFYTDCDVMFRSDPVPVLRRLSPKFFSAAPESDPRNLTYFNSGAMLINVSAMRRSFPEFSRWIRSDPQKALWSGAFDQHALNQFYRGRWDPLPLELNWKAYWEKNNRAFVIHFHGPKPEWLPGIEKGEKTSLDCLVKGGYREYAKEWWKVLGN